MHSKYLKVFGGCRHATHVLRFSPRSEIEAHVGVARYMREDLAVLPQMLKLVPRQVHLIGIGSKGFGKLDNAGRLRGGKRAQQHSVYNGENCGILPDSQPPRQNNANCEPRTLPQHTAPLSQTPPAGTPPATPALH